MENNSGIVKTISDFQRYVEAEKLRYVINSYFQMHIKVIKNPKWRWWKFWVPKLIVVRKIAKNNP